jgi:hypothetical protein
MAVGLLGWVRVEERGQFVGMLGFRVEREGMGRAFGFNTKYIPSPLPAHLSSYSLRNATDESHQHH